MTLTYAKILSLAASVLHDVPHHPCVTPKLLAAICWNESHGDCDAVGDAGKAVGIAQFWWPTFDRFMKSGVCRYDKHRDGVSDARRCPRCSMLALARECDYAMGKHAKKFPTDLTDWPQWPVVAAGRFHNSGRIDGNETAYVRDALRIMEIGGPKWDREKAKAAKAKRR